jgi:hypothetical protein
MIAGSFRFQGAIMSGMDLCSMEYRLYRVIDPYFRRVTKITDGLSEKEEKREREREIK